MSCWDIGKIRKKLTPALRPAGGSTVGKAFMMYLARASFIIVFTSLI